MMWRLIMITHIQIMENGMKLLLLQSASPRSNYSNENYTLRGF